MKKFIGEVGLKQLIRKIFAELDKKQDKMDEMTAEEVRTMWSEVKAAAAA